MHYKYMFLMRNSNVHFPRGLPKDVNIQMRRRGTRCSR